MPGEKVPLYKRHQMYKPRKTQKARKSCRFISAFSGYFAVKSLSVGFFLDSVHEKGVQ